MRIKQILFCVLCLWFNSGFTQDWIFEFDSDDTTINNTWDKSNKTIHNVGFLTTSGKDYRTGLIELNEDGELISYFTAKNCNASAMYLPYGQDSIISVSRKCDGDWVNTFNLFNSDGEKLLTHEFQNKYSSGSVIDYDKGITIMRKDYRNYGGYFHIHELSLDGSKMTYDFSFDELRDNGLDVRTNGVLKHRDGDYFLTAQLYEKTPESTVVDRYPKIVSIKGGKIDWVKSFENRLVSVEKLIETENGYLLYAKDVEKKLILSMDKNGIETNYFYPKSYSRGFNQRFYFKNERLFSIDNGIRGTTIYLQEYDIETGEIIWEKNIPTKYWRVYNLNIGSVDANYFILTGSFVGEKGMYKLSTAFVMKTSFDDTLDAPIIQPKNIKYSIEDLIQESSEDILSTRVYPNPAQFRINFEIEEVDGHNKTRILRIFNAKGSLVVTKEFSGNKLEEDISSLPSGTYFYNIVTGKSSIAIKGKFIVVK